jgi:hypothetical protein
MININEAQLTRADVKDIFKNAALKKKIDINDLQTAWKDDGFPDDTRDIISILKRFGFGERAIEKILVSVFGKDKEGEINEPVESVTIQKVADFAKRHGLTDDLRKFMEREFGEELGLKKGGFLSKFFGRKAVSEEIRQIFTEIIKEERTNRLTLVREFEQERLGRARK